jgi:hypothetical protein
LDTLIFVQYNFYLELDRVPHNFIWGLLFSKKLLHKIYNN